MSSSFSYLFRLPCYALVTISFQHYFASALYTLLSLLVMSVAIAIQVHIPHPSPLIILCSLALGLYCPHLYRSLVSLHYVESKCTNNNDTHSNTNWLACGVMYKQNSVKWVMLQFCICLTSWHQRGRQHLYPPLGATRTPQHPSRLSNGSGPKDQLRSGSLKHENEGISLLL